MYQDKGPQNGVPFHETWEMKIKSWTKDFLSYEIIIPSTQSQSIFKKGEMKIDYVPQPEQFYVVCSHDDWYKCIRHIEKAGCNPYDAIEMLGWNKKYVHFNLNAPHTLIPQLIIDENECKIVPKELQTKIIVTCRHSKFLDSLQYTGLDTSQIVLYAKPSRPSVELEDYFKFMYNFVLLCETPGCASTDHNHIIKAT